MFKSEYFNMGEVIVTSTIHMYIQTNNTFALEINKALNQYSQKDWGNLCDEDKEANEMALRHPEDLYLLGAYETSEGKIYIITNRKSEKAGDNVTTICFPEER